MSEKLSCPSCGVELTETDLHRGYCDKCSDTLPRLRYKEWGALEAALAAKDVRIAELEAALKFYKDRHNYGIGGGSSNRIIDDAGKTACGALKQQPRTTGGDA